MDNLIDLDKLREIVYKGVRRTAVFMGLGINAAYDESFNKYELTDITSIQLVPSNASESEIKHFKEEFALWITMNGFRELIETFSIYLDSIFKICLLIKSTIETIEYPEKQINFFSKKGLEGKFTLIEEKFNIAIPYKDCILTINKARNCLAHRRGLLGVEDCTNEKFELKWKGMELLSQNVNGETTIFDLPIPAEGYVLEKGASLCGRLGQKTISFNIGDVLRITPRDLSEICYFIMILTDEVTKEVMKFASLNGVETIDTSIK